MKNKHWIFLFLGVITVLRLIYVNYLPLLGDEAYYWQWARHLDWGYYEQGPMTALVIFIFTFFTKISTVLTIRLGAIVLSLATMIVLYFAYRKFNPADKTGKENLFNILFINASPIYAAGAVLMMHDTVMVFFYSLFIYNFLNLLDEPENNMHWGHAGIILGLGIMSKLTMGVAYFSVLFLLIFTGSFRKYIKGFFFFTLLTLLFTLPMVIWNFTHDFATFRYLLVRGAPFAGFTLKYFASLIGSQIGLISPLLILLFVPPFIQAIKKPEFKSRYSFALFFAVSILPFVLLSLITRVEANWPAFTFLPMFFLGTQYALSLKKPLRQIAVSFTLVIGFIAITLALTQAAFHPFPFPDRFDPVKKTYGYKELAEKAYTIYNKYNNSGRIFLAARHYQAASLLSFYTPGQPDYHVLVPSEASKNYRFWKGYGKLKGYNCVYAYYELWESWEMAKLFNRLLFTEKAIVPSGRDSMATFSIDYLEGLK